MVDEYPHNSSDAFDVLQENVWYLSTDDGKAQLYVTSIGKGQTVVVLHGGPGNDFNYLVRAIRPHTETSNFVLFDQRGSLLSPIGAEQLSEMTFKTLVDDLETLRKSLNESKIVLLGHSFGTLLALAYYEAYPEHVDKLILTASAPPFITDEKTFSDVIRESHENMTQLRQRQEVASELHKAGLSNETELTDRQKSDRFKITDLASLNLYHVQKWREMQGGRVYYNFKIDEQLERSIPETYDIRSAVAQHPVSITVIQGDHDYLDPSATSWQALANENQFVQIKVVHKAGHHAWIDNPVEFNRQISYALNRTYSV